MLLGKKARKTSMEGRHDPKQGFQRALQCGSHSTALEGKDWHHHRTEMTLHLLGLHLPHQHNLGRGKHNETDGVISFCMQELCNTWSVTPAGCCHECRAATSWPEWVRSGLKRRAKNTVSVDITSENTENTASARLGSTKLAALRNGLLGRST